MKIRHKLLFRLSIFLLSSLLVVNPINFGGFPSSKVNAQSGNRPYVVFVNGYQDCCTWGRYEDGSPAPSMDIVISSLPSNPEIRYVPWDRFENGANQRSSTSNDAEFLRQAADFINQLDSSRPLILIGHSFGGDSLLSLVPRINRRIQFLGVIDPTAAGGLREPVTRRGIPSNVDYFFNRWQQNAVTSGNVVPFDSRAVNGSISGCRAGSCDQSEQSLARRQDGSEIRISCESWEVSCPGYQPWPGGSNGTKAKRLAHNDMPSDEYLQRQMADQISSVLANFRSVQTEVIGNNGWTGSITVDGGYVYLAAEGQLRRGVISGSRIQTEVIGNNGWTGSIAVDGGYVYLAAEGQLRRGVISGSRIQTEVIGNSGWTGSIAVDEGYVYLATAEGQLRRGVISGSRIQTEVIDNGGWSGSIAATDGFIFLTTPDGQLVRGSL
jgi:hypothetical protein